MTGPARSILMIRPAGFRPDVETARDNAFQAASLECEDEGRVHRQATSEFDDLQSALSNQGVDVFTVDGHPDHPDDVFPNNWFSTFDDGTLVLYPMKAISRRSERRPDIVDWLLARYPQLVDLSGWEDRNEFLEGTGSLVLDRDNQLAFAARSERTSEMMVRNWCADFEFEPILFDTSGPGGKPIYHTNVMLSIATSFAIVCTECIEHPAPVLSALLTTGREVIEITRGQMMNFCGNILELQGESSRLIAMSKSAESAFTAGQLEIIERDAQIVSLDISTIEKFGGGGVRCMIAELF